jgi:hypothetical protein
MALGWDAEGEASHISILREKAKSLDSTSIIPVSHDHCVTIGACNDFTILISFQDAYNFEL